MGPSMIRILNTANLSIFLTPAVALAHPSHGAVTFGDSISHYFIEGEHLLLTLPLILFLVATLRKLSQARAFAKRFR